jgi:LDH2 family malate/lactate/ureidoglycolate dehydrogenase
MKLLMFGANEFWYKTFSKTIDNMRNIDEEKQIQGAVVIFINVEKEDENRKEEVSSQAVGNIKWLAKKNNSNKVVLHSFAHLSDSKSSVEFANDIINNIKQKLSSKGIETYVTPFGYFLEFKIHVKGDSLAKVWKAI